MVAGGVPGAGVTVGVALGVPGPGVGVLVEVVVGVAVGVALGVPGPGVGVLVEVALGRAVGVALGVPGPGVGVLVGVAVGVCAGGNWIATEPSTVVPATSRPLTSPKLATISLEKRTGAMITVFAVGVQWGVNRRVSKGSASGKLAVGRE